MWIIFSPRSGLEETDLLSCGSFFHHDLGLKRPTEDVTEAIHYARLSCSKQLLNDVIFFWFNDKNLFTLAILKNSHNNQLYAPAATKKEHIGAKRFLCTRMMFS